MCRSSRRSKSSAPRANVSSRPVPYRLDSARLRRYGLCIAVPLLLACTAWGTVMVYGKIAPSVARWFEVQDITLIGAGQVSRQEVLERLALPPHQNLFTLNPRRLAIRVESHPWIKQATVHRVLPHTLTVAVTERRAAAILRGSPVTLLLDEEGHPISMLSPTDDPGLPVLIGINPRGMLERENRPLQMARQGIELAALLSRTFHGRPEVDVGNPDNVVAYVEGRRLQFGRSSFEEKWDRYQKMELYLPTSAGYGHRESRSDIDLRYPGKVIVRERS